MIPLKRNQNFDLALGLDLALGTKEESIVPVLGSAPYSHTYCCVGFLVKV